MKNFRTEIENLFASNDIEMEMPGLSVLYSQSEIMDQQKGWDVEDQAKDFDFTKDKLWLTTDDGQIIKGDDYLDTLSHTQLEDLYVRAEAECILPF